MLNILTIKRITSSAPSKAIYKITNFFWISLFFLLKKYNNLVNSVLNSLRIISGILFAGILTFLKDLFLDNIANWLRKILLFEIIDVSLYFVLK